MRAEDVVYFNNSRILGEELVPVQYIYVPGGLGCWLF